MGLAAVNFHASLSGNWKVVLLTPVMALSPRQTGHVSAAAGAHAASRRRAEKERAFMGWEN
jgi:hypothetical protein